MNKKKYSVVVFDLGNVLIPFDYKVVINGFEEIEEGLGHKFYKLYYDNYHIHRKFESAQLSEDQFLSIMLDWLDHKVSQEEFCTIYSSLFSLNQDVIDLLPILKKDYKLVLLSNTNSIHQRYSWSKNSFLEHFDKLVLSHEVAAFKPDKKIYRAVESFTQEPSDKHIFIDDILDYVNGAKALGWDGIQFTGYENLVSDLKLRGIL